MQEGREGIEFPLAREDGEVIEGRGDGVGVSRIVSRQTAFRRGLEGVAEGGFEDVAGLQVDGAAEEAGEGFEAGVGLEHRGVGEELLGGVAEPHCFDVAGDDEREFFWLGIFVDWAGGGVGPASPCNCCV